ncbi:glycosyl hydrolase family 65 protein, partial [Amycolatopsis lexingtonensis]
LPDALTRLDFDLRYRGHWLHVELTHDHVDIHARAGAAAPITIAVNDETHTLHSGARLPVQLTDARDSPSGDVLGTPVRPEGRT